MSPSDPAGYVPLPIEELDRRRRRGRAARRRRRVAFAVGAAVLIAGAAALLVVGTTGRAPHRPARSAAPAIAPRSRSRVRATPPATRPGRHNRAVPILMYHVIAPPPAGSRFPGLYVRPSEFAAQTRWLAAHGFHAVTLLRVYDYWHADAPLPRNPIVVSFDDGYRSQYTSALPVLRRLHWPGVLNLAVNNLKPSWGLRPQFVRALVAAGWEIDSHTLTHADLPALDTTRLTEEVTGSRTLLRREFHIPADFFCYPSGRFDDRVVAAVKAAGYLGATTTRFGLAEPAQLYTLARVRVDASDGVSGLAYKLGRLGAI